MFSSNSNNGRRIKPARKIAPFPLNTVVFPSSQLRQAFFFCWGFSLCRQVRSDNSQYEILGKSLITYNFRRIMWALWSNIEVNYHLFVSVLDQQISRHRFLCSRWAVQLMTCWQTKRTPPLFILSFSRSQLIGANRLYRVAKEAKTSPSQSNPIVLTPTWSWHTTKRCRFVNNNSVRANKNDDMGKENSLSVAQE